MVVVAVQLFVFGLYRPPVFTPIPLLIPPQTIISLPVHTAVCQYREVGVLMVLVAVQLFVPGLYLPPVFNWFVLPDPPQTIIWLPVHTAV